MNEIICACCHCELTEDTGFWFDEDYYCQDCLDDTTCLCDHCGRRIWNDDNAGNSERPLCDDCYEDYYTTCEECGRIIHCDDAEYDRHEDVRGPRATPAVVEEDASRGIDDADGTPDNLTEEEEVHRARQVGRGL